MPRQRYRVLHRMNFESPYVEVPMRLTVRQNLTVFGKLYGVANLRERIAELGRQLDLTDLLDRPTGRLVGRAKNPRLARQGADQQPGCAAARRTDCFARSRHRRLGARPSRALLPRAASHRAARLAQHGRGRAAVRAGHHHEARPYRGRRYAGQAVGALWPANAWKKFFSTSCAASPARPRNDCPNGQCPLPTSPARGGWAGARRSGSAR